MNFLKKLAQFLASPFFVGICLTLTFAAIAFFFYAKLDQNVDEKSSMMRILQQLHEKSIDARLRDRGLRAGSDLVAILAVDEKAVERVGRWPWSRDKIARVVKEIKSYGGRVIAFDIIFSEPDPNSSAPSLSRVKDQLKEHQLASPPVLGIVEQELARANSDQILATTVDDFKDHLVMGSYFDEIEMSLTPDQELCGDLAYQKTTVAHNWAHEQASPLVNDTSNVELYEAWIPILDAHFHHLTLQTVGKWMKTQPRALQPVREWLGRSTHSTLSDDEFALALVGWLEKDSEALKELFAKKDVNGAFADNLTASLSQALAHFRRDLLAQDVEAEHRSYCGRFLRKDDELMPEFTKTWPAVQAAHTELAGLTFDQGVLDLRRKALKNPVHTTGRFWMNIPPLIEASQHNGFFNAHLDSDAAVRSAWLLARTGNQYANSIPMKAYLVGKGHNMLVTLEKNFNQPDSKMVSELKIIDGEGEQVMMVPVDTTGRLVINYAGPRYMFPYISMAEFMNDDPEATITQRQYNQQTKKWEVRELRVKKADFVKDKYFFAGATATGIYDLRVTPFEENYPGVETHANVLDNLLRKDFLRLNTDEEIYMPLFLLILGLALSFTLARLGAVFGFLVAFATLVSVYYVDKVFFFNKGVIITIILPMTMILSLYLFLTFYKYFTEERKKKELKGTFEKYVSPAIVNEILADPSHLELGGRKETITVFFSDVRGFTTISEKLDPRALSDLLNSYLTPMTRLVFEHKGTLDKYMGDAIMAFFGAPIHYPDHAQHACRCALSHLKRLKELQDEYERKGLPTIDIGIGLNTGEASVGNMGSDIVRNYTVMGDTVNLGSRLEGINKQYGTRIIISEFTQSEVKADFATREIDLVRVKGKVLPVKIFELVAEGKPAAQTEELLKWFDEGYHLYHQKQWENAIRSFNQALNVAPDDGCAKLYLQRCTDFLHHPPEDDWDGVFIMKTK